VIVLDTHVAVWWTQQPELLSRRAAEAIDRADRVVIPAIVFWETALLVRKGRLALKSGRSVVDWTHTILSIPRVQAVPLSAETALAADGLQMHADPADRFIAATAQGLKAPLLTKDDLLRKLRWLKTVW
jgi:PIN domain nuclease of toxin-antitoxin system